MKASVPGRPHTLTQKTWKQVISLIELDGRIADASEVKPLSTLYRWIEDIPEFAEAVTRAKTIGLENRKLRLARVIQEIAEADARVALSYYRVTLAEDAHLERSQQSSEPENRPQNSSALAQQEAGMISFRQEALRDAWSKHEDNTQEDVEEAA